MIDEKNLNDAKIHLEMLRAQGNKTCELTLEQAEDTFRLARLGLWAEKYGGLFHEIVPSLEHTGVDTSLAADCKKALAALPKEKA